MPTSFKIVINCTKNQVSIFILFIYLLRNVVVNYMGHIVKNIFLQAAAHRPAVPKLFGLRTPFALVAGPIKKIFRHKPIIIKKPTFKSRKALF